jgi:lipopolysaccharide/colanic/teichoic acid biosynthesis glycosyltransferase
MELGYLPNTNTAGKKYKHFSVNTTGIKEAHLVKKTEFFYIGNKTAIIDKLVQSFECGYTSDRIDKSITILTRITENRSSSPDVILADGSITISLLTLLHKFLSANNSLANIPFLIEASGVNENELNDLRKLSFVDEIVFLEKAGNNKLFSKILFIKKIKDSNTKMDLQKNIKKSFNTNNHRIEHFFIKRIFDIFISSVILILLSPLFFIIAIAIKLESKGPVFYIAKRAGRGYKVFNFYKFRTMEVGIDKKIEEFTHLCQSDSGSQKGPFFVKINNDPCISKVGRFLRNTSLDELPQLINVLLGDMSLVGNRPLPLYEAETLTTDDWAERFMAPAGITGLWQIKKHGQEDMSGEERIGFDIAYANRNNFMYDLWIMANTPTALMQKSKI